MAEDPRVALFTSIGLDTKFATESVNNKKLAKNLEQIINEAGVAGGCDKVVGLNLYTLAAKLPPGSCTLLTSNSADLYKYITNGSIKSSAQVRPT